MAEEIRRSGRATKGQHTKNVEETDKAPKKKGRGRSKKAAQPEEEEEEEEESIIRCICGYVQEDESDKRAMICCDKCEAWQHNVCMGMPTDEDDCPDQYFCEQCHPQDHKELLDGIKRGEKPWEERQAKHDQEEEESKAKKRKGGRPPRKSKGLEVDTQPGGSKSASPAVEKPPESGTKRKAPDLAVDTAPSDKPGAKSRKVTTPQEPKPAKRRQSTAAVSATTPTRKDSKVPLQAELVENIADLHNASRQRAAKALDKLFVESVEAAQKEGTFKRSGQSSSELGLRLALTVEYALYLNLWGNAEEPAAQYGSQLRAILHNVKANPSLRDRVIKAQLAAHELSQMSSFDMASKEKQEEAAKIVKDAEKQHVLLEEQAPRIKRTHKGEELIDHDLGNMQSTSIYTNAAVPVPTEGADEHARSPAGEPGSPGMVELPEDVTGAAGEPGKPERKSSSNFNIDNVWSSVDSPASTTKPRPGSAARSAGVKADPDIDHLLKEDEDEEPYSPMDYEAEPGTVWRGTVQMATVAEFRGSARFVAGADVSAVHAWDQLMPPTLYVEGRIDVDKAGEYLCGLRFSNSTDVTVVQLTPTDSPDDEAQFDRLFAYFTDRRRYGVVARSAIPLVRDIYVVPLDAGDAPKPDFIELLRDCDLPAHRPRRSLLVTYVIKVRPNGAAAPAAAGQQQQQQPHQQPFRTPSLPHPAMSPVAPGGPAASPVAPLHHKTAPASPPLYQQVVPADTPGLGLTGMAAAQAVLGPLAAEPVVPQLLALTPNAGEWEFTHIKRAMEVAPETRQDLSKLMQNIQAMMSGTSV